VRRIQDPAFLIFVLAVSAAFAWIVLPLFGAILWSVVAGILFAPLNDRLLRAMPQRRSLAAFLTLLVIITVVVLPALFLAALLLQEATNVYARIQSGAIDPAVYFVRFQAHLPHWLTGLMERSGLSDFAAVQAKLSAGIAARFQSLTAQAFSLGQSAFGFVVALGVMLYVTFFLLRDGKTLSARIEQAVPLQPDRRTALFSQFITVVRATIKGSLVVAAVQGVIGGIIFWALDIRAALLWGVAMGFLSLFPAIGTGLIWVPVAIYLLVTGALWQGTVLILCGLFVIGMVDNILRPILVGRDARMPDYVVLISTLGGLEVLGFNGLVIGPVIAGLFLASWEILAKPPERLQAPE
jgi:predicted PurR-regulated permease PerM